MRILFIIHQFMPEFAAGTERVTLNLAKAAQRDGHSVEVLTCSLQPEAPWMHVENQKLRFAAVEGIPVYALPAYGRSRLIELGFERDDATASAFKHFLQAREPFDVVHVTHPMRMVDILAVISDCGIPYVITLTDFYMACWRTNLVRADGSLCAGPAGGAACIRHCSTLQLSDTVLLRRRERMERILHGAAAVTACSNYVADVFRAEFPGLTVRVVHHGIDLLRFVPPAAPRAGKPIVFGFIGTLSEMKGVHILAAAFARAAPPNAKLRLIGSAPDEPFLEHLLGLGEGTSATVEPAIEPQAVPAVVGSFDVLCLPSMVPETFSLAVHEGFAAGIPCLVSDLGYPAELVRTHHCGRTAPAGDVAVWAEAIRTICGDRTLLDTWRTRVPLPLRLEEEGFVYAQLYRGVAESRNGL